MTERLSAVEKATIRLTTIQEVQTEQMKQLLEYGKTTVVVVNSVKEHSNQILDLYRKVHEITEKLHDNRKELNKDLTEARNSLNKASYGRLIMALTVAVGLSWKLHEMSSKDIDDLLQTKTIMLKRVTVVEEANKHIHEHLKAKTHIPYKPKY